MAVQIIFMKEDQKAILFKFKILKLDVLLRTDEGHGTILMIVFCSPIANNAGFELFKSDEIKVTRKRPLYRKT